MSCLNEYCSIAGQQKKNTEDVAALAITTKRFEYQISATAKKKKIKRFREKNRSERKKKVVLKITLAL